MLHPDFLTSDSKFRDQVEVNSRDSMDPIQYIKEIRSLRRNLFVRVRSLVETGLGGRGRVLGVGGPTS